MKAEIEHPPIWLGSFLSQDFTDEEYFRERKPNGDLYKARDSDSGKRCHAGQDLQDPLGDRTLFAVWDGVAKKVDFGDALGIQTVVQRNDGTVGALYCHQDSRTGTFPRPVKAGEPIGVMGGTGGVPVHLHFAFLKRFDDFGTLFNLAPSLRAAKEAWMKQLDDIMAELKVIKSTQRALTRFILDGTNSPTSEFVPDDEAWVALASFGLKGVHEKLGELTTTLNATKKDVAKIKAKVGA